MNVSITQTITSVTTENCGSITRVEDNSSPSQTLLTWNGDVRFNNSAERQVFVNPIRRVIQTNRSMTLGELNTAAQSLYTKDYDDCNNTEAKAARHKVLGDTWKIKIKALTTITISDSDADTLVNEILNNCCA